jgi:adenylate kinase
VYNEWFKPPKVWGVCDFDGSELVHRADDAEATVRARMEQQLGPLHEVADYYRSRGILTPVDGLRPIEDVAASLLEALGHPAPQAR